MSDPSPATRLVIRIKLPSGEQPPPPARARFGRGPLLVLISVAAVAVLIWVGISLLRTGPAPVTVPGKTTPAARNEASPKPSAGTIGPQVRKQPAALASSIDKVIPDVPRSARETIRGTIRVSVRVIVNRDGTVLAATTDKPGPSRYFDRLAVDAAKQWTFTPANSLEQRVLRVRFYFKRTGTTASVDMP